jgi:hypothetical protein
VRTSAVCDVAAVLSGTVSLTSGVALWHDPRHTAGARPAAGRRRPVARS